MSTRCFIGYRTEDKKINGVYCGHDGYPAHVGRILLDNYQVVTKNVEHYLTIFLFFFSVNQIKP